jgi:hypothetical protein
LQPDVTTLSWDVSVSAENSLNIREPGSTKAKPGLLSITLENNLGPFSSAIAHNGPSHTSSADILSPTTASSRIPSTDQDPSDLAVTVQNANKSVAGLRGPLNVSKAADIVDHGATASSSDGFNTALSIMSNFIKVGDILSEVSSCLRLMFASILNLYISVSSFRKVGLEHPDCGAEGTSYVSLHERR